MSLKRKDNRAHLRIHPSLSPQPISHHHFKSSPLDVERSLDSKHARAYITDLHSVTSARSQFKPVKEQKARSSTNLKEVKMPCQKHTHNDIKFVDIRQDVFQGLCDTCLVKSEFNGKNMRLEKLSEIYNKKRKELIKTAEEIQELEGKISQLYKDIVRTNIMVEPLLKELDEMEKKTIKEVEKCFKKIKAKFIKFNPFRDTRELIREKLEEAQYTLDALEENSEESFDVLKEIYTGKNRIIADNQALIKDIHTKIEINKQADPLQDKDFNIFLYEYNKFSEKFVHDCERLTNTVKVKY